MVDRIFSLPLSPFFSLFTTEQSLVYRGEDLLPMQNHELSELVDQFSDVFSTELGLTYLLRPRALRSLLGPPFWCPRHPSFAANPRKPSRAVQGTVRRVSDRM